MAEQMTHGGTFHSLLLLTVYVLFFLLGSITESYASSFSLLIDSTFDGCTLYIYQYPSRVQKFPDNANISIPTVVGVSSMTPQQISAFVGNTQNIRSYLLPLIQFAMSPPGQVYNEILFGRIPIFFKGDGYMRSMRDVDRTSIMSEVIDLLSDPTFCPFLFYPGFARVISGTEEAMASWVTANFHLGVNFTRQGYDYVDSIPSLTYGVIDINQFSTQVKLSCTLSVKCSRSNMYIINELYCFSCSRYLFISKISPELPSTIFTR